LNKKFRVFFSALPSLRHVVVIPFVPDYSMDLSAIPNRFLIVFYFYIFIEINFSLTIDEFLAMPGETTAPLEFEQVPFNHPLFIISILFTKFLKLLLVFL
jgi:hypothetical protein